MAETKSDQNAEKITESVKSSGGPTKSTQSKSKSKTTKTSAVAGKAVNTVKKAAQRSRSGAAKAEKAVRELGEGIKDTMDKEITPAAERATRRVADTTKQVREELGSAAEKAKKGFAETSKKVREELGPAAEKAGKGLSSLFKSTAKATRKSARILGIKASIAAEMRKRQKLLADLGERYFQAQKKKTPSQSDKDALSALVGEIKKVEAEIHTLEVKEKATREST
jgi:hypothetical protein